MSSFQVAVPEAFNTIVRKISKLPAYIFQILLASHYSYLNYRISHYTNGTLLLHHWCLLPSNICRLLFFPFSHHDSWANTSENFCKYLWSSEMKLHVLFY